MPLMGKTVWACDHMWLCRWMPDTEVHRYRLCTSLSALVRRSSTEGAWAIVGAPLAVDVLRGLVVCLVTLGEGAMRPTHPYSSGA